MTPEGISESERRTKGYESCRLYKYKDTKDVTTFAWGYALQDPATDRARFMRLGIDYDKVAAAPTAINSDPENALPAIITQADADQLFAAVFPNYLADARESLSEGTFDALSDARAYVVFQMCYTMGSGPTGWGAFGETKALIEEGVQLKAAGNDDEAHARFEAAAAHIGASGWFEDVGSNAGTRGPDAVAMMQDGGWVPPISS